jgi:cellulose synthase/poly-beta-1,6-N-acetylglucosamine synthase-like glycosyltransferase
MIIAVFIVIIIYFVIHLIFFIGIKKSESIKMNDSDFFPLVSVIIAARNEELNIVNCINSLKKLNYPKDKYQIILINDNSTDRTEELMLRETKGYNEFLVLNTRDYSGSNLKGKVNALSYGISKSSGELYMMTDADCEVPPDWIRDTVKYYDSQTGLICGFTMIDYRNSIFAKLQSLDWIYLQSIATASSGINSELSCIGNNLSVSAKAYNEIGGYENLKFSVTEDLALLRKIKGAKAFSILYPINNNCLIKTSECKTLKDLYNQKRRWFRGGLEINLLGYILGFELYSLNIILLFGLLFLSSPVYLFAIIVKFMSDLLLIIPVYNKFKYKGLIKYFPIFQIYFAICGLLLPFTFITGSNIVWKGRNH